MKPSISGYVVRCSKDTYRDTCSKDVAVMRNKTMAEALRSSGDDMGAGQGPGGDRWGSHALGERMSGHDRGEFTFPPWAGCPDGFLRAPIRGTGGTGPRTPSARGWDVALGQDQLRVVGTQWGSAGPGSLDTDPPPVPEGPGTRTRHVLVGVCNGGLS